MAYSRLYLLVEGPDDQRFAEWIIKPRFEGKFDYVMVWPYCNEKKSKLRALLKSINKMDASYIYFHDLDKTKCSSLRKTQLIAKCNLLDPNNIIIVKKEIESWYLAGINSGSAKKLKIKHPGDTEPISKESFEALMPKAFSSIVDFMIEILKLYRTDIAKDQNNSFKYLFEKHEL